jgi:serine/threonine-protein kinase
VSLSQLTKEAERTGKRLPIAVASRILHDVLIGLHEAHEAVDNRRQPLGIVHRDISPQNIVVGVDGVSRVIDFGIAKATSRLTQTKSGIVKGKVAYMAPEQIEAQPLDRRTDIFAAGIVLHEALTGRCLFSGADEFETMRRILRGQVPAPSAVGTGVSPALDAVVRQALERSPKARFPTALAFQAALEKAMPPATQREVGVWVQRVGGSTLSGRRKELLEMLRDGATGSAAPRAPTLVDTEAAPLVFVDASVVTGETEPIEGVAGLHSPRVAALALRVGAAAVGLVVIVGAAALYRSRTVAEPTHATSPGPAPSPAEAR